MRWERVDQEEERHDAHCALIRRKQLPPNIQPRPPKRASVFNSAHKWFFPAHKWLFRPQLRIIWSQIPPFSLSRRACDYTWCGPPSPLLVVFGCGSPLFCLAMHPRGGREGRLPLPRPAGPKQEYQMDPQREKAMRSIFGEAEVPD